MSMFNVSNDTSTFDYMNSFFGNASSTGSSFGASSFLTDYYSIKSGSYYKVAKKYYSSDEVKNSNKSSNTSTAEEKKTTLVKSAAETAVGSLSKLMDDSLYRKVETKDSDGSKVMDYDRTSIQANLKKFVEGYNELVKGTGDLDDRSTLKSGVRLVNQTKVYEKALNSIGVNIKADNTMEIDEKAFAKADMLNVKSMFTGNVSFAKNIQNKFLQIYSSASNAIEGSDGLYSSQAKKSISVGNMFDSMF